MLFARKLSIPSHPASSYFHNRVCIRSAPNVLWWNRYGEFQSAKIIRSVARAQPRPGDASWGPGRFLFHNGVLLPRDYFQPLFLLQNSLNPHHWVSDNPSSGYINMDGGSINSLLFNWITERVYANVWLALHWGLCSTHLDWLYRAGEGSIEIKIVGKRRGARSLINIVFS